MQLGQYLLQMLVSTSIFTVDQETKKFTAIKNMCVERNGLNTSHLKHLSPPEARNYITLEKWTCITACILERTAGREQSLYRTVLDDIETAIPSTSVVLDKDQLIETLNSCKSQVGERGCSLLKCMKVWEPPLPNVLHIPSYY